MHIEWSIFTFEHLGREEKANILPIFCEEISVQISTSN